jgi:hypothetical protein
MLKTVGNPSTRYGDQTVIDGNIVVGTAGKGIDFSADPSSPGMTSELLDDYEEGTFTPTLSFGGTPIAVYNAQDGSYVKIGRVVYFRLFIQVQQPGGGTGNAVIGGLPFTSANSLQWQYGVNIICESLTGLTGAPFGRIAENSSEIALYQTDATGGTPITNSAFTIFSSDNVYATGFYFV